MSEGASDSGIIDKALLRKASSNLGGASLITFIRRQTRSKVRKIFAFFTLFKSFLLQLISLPSHFSQYLCYASLIRLVVGRRLTRRSIEEVSVAKSLHWQGTPREHSNRPETYTIKPFQQLLQLWWIYLVWDGLVSKRKLNMKIR